ncbi:MAG: DUF2283 domain-containing protein [Phycisphaerales bacterium]|nr:DUF2283 domain-containing protein [Phycisphaerales bacterium]
MRKNGRTKHESRSSNPRRRAKRPVVYTDEPMELGKTVPDFLPPPDKLRFSPRIGPRVVYDAPSDTLTLRLSNRPVAESDEASPGVILDFDADGQVIGVELLKVSERSANPRSIELTVNT